MEKKESKEKMGRGEKKAKRRELGNYLYQARIRKNYTLVEASEAMNIHKSTLCRYELGEIRRMSDRVAEAVCETYGISRQDLAELRLPESEERFCSRKDMLSEDEFLRVYRALDDRGRRRVQYLAGLQLQLARPKTV